MAYSFTEKKRIRKSFAKRASVLPVPFLLATQIDSYAAFLQAETLPDSRKNEGLQAAFTSIFPIESHSRNARLEFVSYALGMPPFDVKECQQRGLTFASPLRAKVRLTIMDKEASKPTVKEVKEQEVYMGEIPLMTTTGSFVINGTERVIVSQLHRSPGVFFEHDRGKTHSSGQAAVLRAHHPVSRLLARLRVRPQGLPVFPRRPPPQDAGDDPAEGDRHTRRSRSSRNSSCSTRSISQKGEIEFELVPERMRGEIARFDILTKSGKLIVPKDKRITVKHVREMETAGLQTHRVPEDFLHRPGAGAQRRGQGDRRDPRHAPTTRSPKNCSRSCGKPACGRSRPSTPTISTRVRTSPRPCASTRPPTRWRRRSRSTA